MHLLVSFCPVSIFFRGSNLHHITFPSILDSWNWESWFWNKFNLRWIHWSSWEEDFGADLNYGNIFFGTAEVLQRFSTSINTKLCMEMVLLVATILIWNNFYILHLATSNTHFVSEVFHRILVCIWKYNDFAKSTSELAKIIANLGHHWLICQSFLCKLCMVHFSDFL